MPGRFAENDRFVIALRSSARIPLVEQPRYLIPFHPKHVGHRFTDLLIIGGGIAGLRAANAADPSQAVLVVTKDEMLQSSSNYAQGGIAGVMDPEDRFENHIEDTLTAGAGLCIREVVELVIREAPQRIAELAAWGAGFDEEAGHLALGKEGGHSHHRVVHALGDATGKEIMRALLLHTEQAAHINLMANTFTLDLLTDEAGTCRGAVVWDAHNGTTLIWAKQTILCAGGAGQLYRETTNPPVATGDGVAIAHRAGAELRDLEFMQFHPTVLYIPGSSRVLITEATRGEGAYLLDATGHRFMPDYDSRGELAPRDVVSQAIENQMEKTHHSCVYLSLAHLSPERVRSRFPGLAAVCSKFQLDVTSDPIPVRPGAHYMIGGITVNLAGQTSLPGLWAAGEVTSSGLHGANRLASNSLLEGLVFGAHAGEAASQAALEMPNLFEAPPLSNLPLPAEGEPLDLDDIRNSLKTLMWRKIGIRRDGESLVEAREAVDSWCRYVLSQQFADPSGWQLQNMLTVARLMIAAALAREESRGVHLRSDFPDTDDTSWHRRLVFSPENGDQPR